MNATATKGSIGRIFALAAGAFMAMALGAAIALAATGSLGERGSSAVPAFDPTGALQGHVPREYGTASSAPAIVVDDALHEHVMRENRAR